MESSWTSLASRTSWRTHFEVLGLGLEANKPSKMSCPRLKDSTIFDVVRMGHGHDLLFTQLRKTVEISWKICEDLFFLKNAWKIFLRTVFFFRTLAPCIPGPWPWSQHSCPWPREGLSLRSRSLASIFLSLGSKVVSST